VLFKTWGLEPTWLRERLLHAECALAPGNRARG
jgi:hypothetical protein